MRAAICMGVPVLVGWIAGDVPAGLMATIGAFTALYGGDRPFRNRAAHLAVVALSFAATVTLGVWTAGTPMLAIPAVVLIAMVAAFLCNALRIGPPGAYMFALACAAGTGMQAGHLSLLEVALLVLGGGMVAWLAHMVGMFVSPRGPERAAVLAAAQAVARFVDALGTPEEDTARHLAALAMHESWTTLVTHQPRQPVPDGALSHLRAINRELNLIFADILNTPPAGAAAAEAISRKVRGLASEAMDASGEAERTDPGHVPLGHHGLVQSLRESLRPGSTPLLVAARVGLAAAAAGAIGAAFDLERAYWTMAAAVLILHQGLGWTRSWQRGVERMSGTMIGLILAGSILWIHPQGLWLVLALMVLQFTIEMTVIRNYALAVVFITAAALTIAAGGHPVPDVGHLLWVRGVDTAIGCVVGLMVLLLTTPRTATMRIPQELANTLVALQTALHLAARGEIGTDAAWRARRDLQHRTLILLRAYDAAIDASPLLRDSAERSWPAVVAVQRLAYRALATFWSLERAGAGKAPEEARILFGSDGEHQIDHAISALSEAIGAGTVPAPLTQVPKFLATEMQNLQDSLVRAGDTGP
ncbi:MAG: hypothetical protein ABS76_37450 [Pelagibacterium sp. SCN 64-44]|nr:MAG: hypothetical protein ABS76_37450 [Pelagibacterium sp. SCN 64-44]